MLRSVLRLKFLDVRYAPIVIWRLLCRLSMWRGCVGLFRGSAQPCESPTVPIKGKARNGLESDVDAALGDARHACYSLQCRSDVAFSAQDLVADPGVGDSLVAPLARSLRS